MPKLSVYDEKLSDIAKEGIRAAKQKYNIAKQNNDKAGMTKANQNANQIRRIYGGYTGGEDGSEFNPVYQMNYEKPKYTSRYDNLIKNTRDKIMNKPSFSYDPEKDPAYLLYKKIYTEMGNDAYDRAISQNSIKTGGIVNTNAMTSAMLAKNKYNSELAKIATDLYNNAYKEYKDSIDHEYDTLDMLNSLENADYAKYLDAVDNYNYENKLNYEKYRDDMTDYYDEVNNSRLNDEFEYKKLKDSIENKRLDEEFEYEKSQDEKQMEYDNKKLDFEVEKWKEQSKTDKYNTLARLIQSVYNKSNIGVNVQRMLNLMGN